MSKAVKYYLLAYNGIAFLAWALFFIVWHFSGLSMHESLVFLNIAQGLAVLEVVHAILKWVKSPILSTASQVASRILVLIMINIFITDDDQIMAVYGLIVVTYAWSITELIRYSFYFLSLLDIEPRWLLWMRYSFFIGLYPLGVTGEWLIILSPIIAFGFAGSHLYPLSHLIHSIRLEYYTAFILLLAISYIYYFPVLYKYMWKQRKVKL